MNASAKPATRDRLLQAVIEIAGREGQHMVTYRSVAARANVAHGLVRHYFGTREAMLNEAMHLAASQDIDAVTLSASSAGEFADGMVDMLTTDWPRQILQFDLTLNAIRGIANREAAVEIYDHYIAEIAKTLRDLDIDDPNDSLAAVLMAALDGLTLQHALYESTERTEEALQRVRELLALLSSHRDR